MEVDALQEAVMHIGTELQALKVNLPLSCHADYQWICVTTRKKTRQIITGRKLETIFWEYGIAPALV